MKDSHIANTKEIFTGLKKDYEAEVESKIEQLYPSDHVFNLEEKKDSVKEKIENSEIEKTAENGNDDPQDDANDAKSVHSNARSSQSG